MSCRLCGRTVRHSFVDLGMSPLCQTHITAAQLNQMEPFYPLHARVCEHCFLVQLGQFVGAADIFSEYAYFASYSDSWVEHARRYVGEVSERFGLGPGSRVLEIASNDGYLLQHFLARGVTVLGVEPAANVAAAAVARGVPSLVKFFGRALAEELARDFGRPDLIIGNNVLAHVPDLNDFVAGMQRLLGPDGVITMEFPHLLELMRHNQFDTIYHEHFSYFSFTTACEVFRRHELVLFDVEQLPTHGGSLRIYARHAAAAGPPVSERARELLVRERQFGLGDLVTYAAFAGQVRETKRALLEFLIGAKRAGKRIVGYGAPGKGNTLLNYCGIGVDFLDFTVDRNPYKQGKYTPGMHIPIRHPDELIAADPDYVLILPWNLKDEVLATVGADRRLRAQFVVPIPRVQVLGARP
jgi:SAM-dependent methyltransferase